MTDDSSTPRIDNNDAVVCLSTDDLRPLLNGDHRCTVVTGRLPLSYTTICEDVTLEDEAWQREASI